MMLTAVAGSLALLEAIVDGVNMEILSEATSQVMKMVLY